MKRLAFVWLLLALSACSTPTVPNQQYDPLSFTRSGRFAVQTLVPKQQGVQGGFVWLDQPHSFQLQLLSPFGTVLAELQTNKQGAKLINEKGDVFEITNAQSDHPAQELIQSQLGEALPLEAMRFWIQGKPDPLHSIEDDTKREDGQVVRFRQLNWTINFDDYDAKGPTKIRLEQKTSNRHILVRLIIEPQ